VDYHGGQDTIRNRKEILKMRTLRNKLIALAAVVILAVVGTLMNSRQAAAQGPPGGLAVNVVNSIPLQVTGSVGISGNSATSPLFTRDVDNPARQPFQTSICDFGNATTNLCGSLVDSFSVPSGHRLVIEFIMGLCRLSNVAVRESLITQAGGNGAEYFLPFSVGTIGGNGFAQQTRIYADPGSRVGFGGGEVNGAGPFTCTLSLSGYTTTL
jgi:hypothetical protein